MLVWEVRSRKKHRERSGGEGSRSERRRAQLQQWRERFAQNLQAAGLLLEKVRRPIPCAFTHRGGLQERLIPHPLFILQEETANERKTIHFLKISAPWEVLVCYAEELCLRAPLQVRTRTEQGSSTNILLSQISGIQVSRSEVGFSSDWRGQRNIPCIFHTKTTEPGSKTTGPGFSYALDSKCEIGRFYVFKMIK